MMIRSSPGDAHLPGHPHNHSLNSLTKRQVTADCLRSPCDIDHPSHLTVVALALTLALRSTIVRPSSSRWRQRPAWSLPLAFPFTSTSRRASAEMNHIAGSIFFPLLRLCLGHPPWSDDPSPKSKPRSTGSPRARSSTNARSKRNRHGHQGDPRARQARPSVCA
jgi:hypothetical protein